jgi:hypothetical protein
MLGFRTPAILYVYETLLERLPQALQDVAAALRPCIQEEHAVVHERHLARDLVFSEHTAALYAAYRRYLGPWRYALMRQVQAALVGHGAMISSRCELHFPFYP